MKSELNVSAETPRISSRNANMTPSLEYLYIKVYSFFTTCTSGGGSCFHNGSKSSYRNLYSLLSPGPFISLTRGDTGVWDRKIVFIKYYQLHSTSRRNKNFWRFWWRPGGIKRKTFSPICVSLLWEVNDNEIFTEEFISQSKVIFFPVNLLLLQCLFCAAPTFKLCTKKIRNISSY